MRVEDDAHGRRATGKERLHKVKASCPTVKWLAHYGILGAYDFMDIYDAAHKRGIVQRDLKPGNVVPTTPATAV